MNVKKTKRAIYREKTTLCTACGGAIPEQYKIDNPICPDCRDTIEQPFSSFKRCKWIPDGRPYGYKE